jgi:two-component SAPR family response regulator
MKPFDIKINCFGGLNLPQQQLSLSKRESNDLFSLLNQKKKRKIKFGIKIYVFKITETDHLIVKKK